jgi:hypothetical protein
MAIKVKDLIEKLSKENPEAEVWVEIAGNEGSVAEVIDSKPTDDFGAGPFVVLQRRVA